MGKSVFVLGAGASRAFGDNMPIGEQLAEQIEMRLFEEFHDRSNPTPITNVLTRRPGGMTGAHERAADYIIGALQGKPSIDELINDFPDFPEIADVGKAAIAVCILHAEAQTQLNLALSEKARWGRTLRTLRRSWASKMFREIGGVDLSRRAALEALSGVAFVTFNYDRCLEQFLLANFMHTSSMTVGQATDALKQIEIHHVYGDLGLLPIMTSQPGKEANYGSDETWVAVQAASRIRTFTEEQRDPDRIYSVIAQARRLTFLGFGYHERNLDALFGPANPCPNIPCFGTRADMADRAKRRMHQRFMHSPSIVWEDCYADPFMEKYGDDILSN
jgi:hypothetical protein